MLIPDNIKDWTVLVVDDEPDNVGIVQKVFSFYGADVHVAADGLQGLDILESVFPTFVLLDLSMPKMDGWEMHAKMRADPRYANIPVIALTAHVMDGDKERVSEAGFNGYIPKPFRIASFLKEVKAILQQVAVDT
jgi:CheY-like chemotaxis protein